MDETYRLWAANIRFGRRALKLTQLSLARACGVSQQTVAKWESADAAPRDEHKVLIARALHQDVRQLFPLIDTAAVAS
jgi:transcriptional regulator with XRE-family HTH domain